MIDGSKTKRVERGAKTMSVNTSVRQALDTIFESDSKLYTKQGWNQRAGYGKRPAILNIDLANAWTRAGYRFSCNDTDQIILNTNKLLVAARAKKIPILYTTTAYCS